MSLHIVCTSYLESCLPFGLFGNIKTAQAGILLIVKKTSVEFTIIIIIIIIINDIPVHIYCELLC
jgi:hypothetical protein